MLWRCYDGSEHPVSRNFLKIVPVELNGVPFERIERIRLATASQPNVQSYVRALELCKDGDPPPLPDAQTMIDLNRISACDHVNNINRSLVMLDGRDYRSHNELFGPKGTLCQVHHNEWQPDCGCRLPFIYDHWLRSTPYKIVFYPHTWRMYHCPRHAGKGDYSDIFFAVQREFRNTAKAA